MAISVEQFLSNIAASELLRQDEVSALIEALPEESRPKTGEELARELVRLKRLTKYQAEQIYAGKGKALVLGNYIVLEKLGQGGMGVVLKAEHKRLKRPVAIKVMSPSIVKTPDALKRFHREVEAAAKLRHPNVVATDDANEAKGTHFLVMEYVEGSDLSALVKKNGPLSVNQALQCIIQAARGLEFAHGRGVIHRDIKPANLLLNKAGVVKILDMGLARIEGNSNRHSELTSTGAIMGTVDYMAPEQALSTKDADARSDIYSLGLSLWYLLTGRCAFEGDSLMAKLLAHREAEIPSLVEANDEVPEWLDDVFRRMVAKQRSDRYQSMTEVICDLERGQGSPSKNVAMPAMHEDADLQSFLRQLGNSNPDTAPTLKAKATPLPSTVNPADDVTGVMGQAAVETDTQAQVTIQASSPRKPTNRKKSGESSAARLWYRNPRILMAGGIAGCVLMIAVLFLLRGPDTAPDAVNLARDVKGGSQPTDENVTASPGDQVPEAAMDPPRQGAESVTEQMPVIASRATLEDSPVTTPVIGKHGLRFRPDQTIEMRLSSPPETVECTLEMWVTPDISIDTMGGAILLSTVNGGLTVNRDRFRFYTFHAGAESEVLLRPGRRIHLAGVNDTKRRSLYLDGKLIAVLNDAGTLNPDKHPAVQWIGGDRFQGTIEAIRISRVARYHGEFTPPASFANDTNTVVLYQFDEGWGDVLRDSSGNGAHGKVQGPKWVTYDGTSWVDRPAVGELVDLLAKVKLPENSLKGPTLGDWKWDGKVLLSPGDHRSGRIQLDFEPPPEYEIMAVVERVHGVDGVMLGVIVDGHPAEVGIDVFLPQVSGLSWINGKELPETDTVFRETVLQDKNLHTIRVTVGRKSVRATVDDREVLDWEGDPNSLGSPTILPNPKNYWFGTGFHQFKFHKLQLRPLVLSDGLTDADPDRWPFDPADAFEYEWSVPENLGPEINTPHYEEHPELTGNGLELWHSGGGELWISSRDAINAPWKSKVNASTLLNEPGAWDSEPTLSADGLTLVFCSDRENPSADQNLMMSTRLRVDEPFGKPMKLGGDINSPLWDNCPTLSADGLTLIYSSAHEGVSGSLDLWKASRSTVDGQFGDLAKLEGRINSAAQESGAYLSADGKVLIFESSRHNGLGKTDLYYCTRESPDRPFRRPISFGSMINSADDDQGACLSADGLTLLFYSNRPGGFGNADLWQSRRVRKGPRPVPLDGLPEVSYVGHDQIRVVDRDDAGRGSLKNNFPGITAKHGVIVHPDGEPNGTCQLIYELGGRYKSLSATTHCRPSRGNPVFAEVLGDGKSLWKSRDLSTLKFEGDSFEIDVTGVNQLILSATSEKDMFAAHVLWKNPRLRLKQASK